VFEFILKKIARELKKRKIPYMVIGGQAVLLYGEPRFTRDIDITLGVDVDAFHELEAAAQKMGFKPAADNPEKLAVQTNVFPVIDKKSGIRIDFIFSYSDYERTAIKRSKNFDLHGVKVKYISPEDLIIHKLVAGRPRDIEDVENILLKIKIRDPAYIKKWLKNFDRSLLGDRLGMFEKAMKESRENTEK
jgi:predicted nucleotidyltransferase